MADRKPRPGADGKIGTRELRAAQSPDVPWAAIRRIVDGMRAGDITVDESARMVLALMEGAVGNGRLELPETSKFDAWYLYWSAWLTREDGSLCHCLCCSHVRREVPPQPRREEPDDAAAMAAEARDG